MQKNSNKIILAIDPGPKESAFVFWDGIKIHLFGKEENNYVRNKLSGKLSCRWKPDIVVIEQVASYGMPVGEDVFETVFWSGIFAAHCEKFDRLKRHTVKMHLCNSTRARDSNIITALIDRFDPERNFGKYGKGTKKNPGPFYCFSKDVWQAFALAVTYLDING